MFWPCFWSIIHQVTGGQFVLAVDSDEWLVVCPRETAPGTHYIRGWVSYKTVLDISEKGNICCPCCESNHDPLVFPLVITLTTVSLLHTHIYVLRTIIVRYIHTHMHIYILYGCYAQSITLSVWHKLRVFKNKVLRNILGTKR